MQLLEEGFNYLINNFYLLNTIIGAVSSSVVLVFVSTKSYKNHLIRKTHNIRYKLVKYAAEDKISYNSLYATFNAKNIGIINPPAYIKVINNIVKIFNSYIKKNNLEVKFSRNLNNLTVENYAANAKNFLKELKLIIDRPALGLYRSGKNRIEIYQDDKYVISHEFLHMISTSNPTNVGFQNIKSINNNAVEYGIGLNEGYTEILNNRIFGCPLKKCCYKDDVRAVRMLELLFDDKKQMEQAYFNADIGIVTREFLKYGSLEEFIDILEKLDNCARTFNSIYKKIDSVKMSMKLYEIVKRTGDEKKIKEAEKILDETKITHFMRKRQNMKIHRNEFQSSKSR